MKGFLKFLGSMLLFAVITGAVWFATYGYKEGYPFVLKDKWTKARLSHISNEQHEGTLAEIANQIADDGEKYHLVVYDRNQPAEIVLDYSWAKKDGEPLKIPTKIQGPLEHFKASVVVINSDGGSVSEETLRLSGQMNYWSSILIVGPDCTSYLTHAGERGNIEEICEGYSDYYQEWSDWAAETYGEDQAAENGNALEQMCRYQAMHAAANDFQFNYYRCPTDTADGAVALWPEELAYDYDYTIDEMVNNYMYAGWFNENSTEDDSANGSDDNMADDTDENEENGGEE